MEAKRTTTVAAKVSGMERSLLEAGAKRRGASLSALMREGAVALALEEIDGYRADISGESLDSPQEAGA